MSYDEYPYSNFDPDTGRTFSKFTPVRAFQKLTSRIGFNALLVTLPSEEDTPLKRSARTIARHLLSAADVNTHLNDPALSSGVSEIGIPLSGVDRHSRSRRATRAAAGVTAAAAAVAVIAPQVVEFIDSGAEMMVRIYENANTIPNYVPEYQDTDSAPSDARPTEYQYLYPDNILEP
jgi:hypothetical protein